MQLKKFIISSSSIKNQHRFPISKYGWPLREVAKLILNDERDWNSKAKSILNEHLNRRLYMNSLYDLYKINELSKWDIDSCFIPWFSQRPLLTKSFFDRDYTDSQSIEISISKLRKLIESIEKNGFLENENIKKNIIVYPIDINKNAFYVRTGNHRVAVLSAMKKNIPCYLDNISYLKALDKNTISKYIWKFNTGIKYKKYPHIDLIKNWPSVKSRVLSEESALKILELFS